MTTILTPPSNRIKGPWILNSDSLESLDSTIEKIWLILTNQYERSIRDELQSIPEEIAEDIFESKIRNRSTNQLIKKEVNLYFKNKKTLQSDNVLTILKNPILNDLSAASFSVIFQKGDNEFKFDIKNDTLYYFIRCENIEAKDEIIYELNKWISEFRPKTVVTIWHEYAHSQWWLFIIFLIGWGVNTSTNEDAYNRVLKSQAKELINKGIDSTNICQAVDIILKKEIAYMPKDYSYTTLDEPTFFNNKFALMFFILSIILSIVPKTTIGVGRIEWRSKFWRWWIYFVTASIPSSLVIPWIIEKIWK